MKKNDDKTILFLTRPFSNTLDAGTKSIPYYIAKFCRRKIAVFVEDGFHLPLPESARKIATGISSDRRFVENSRSIKNKLSLLKRLLFNLHRAAAIHAFFVPSAATSSVLLMAKLVWRKKIIINIPQLEKKFFHSPVIRLFFRNVDCIVLMSQDSFRKLNGYANHIEVVPPIVDQEKYNPHDEESRNRIKQKLGIKEKHIIMFPGEYGALNANDNMIEIVKLVEGQRKDTLFIFSCRLKTEGDVAKEQYVKAALKNFNVLFLNTIDNYHEYAAVSDFGIFPAKDMTGKFDLPLALVELMAMGKPIIHTDIAPLNELYSDRHGFCFPDDMRAMSDRLLELIENQPLYTAAIETTLKEAKRFLAPSVMPCYEEIYEKYI